MRFEDDDLYVMGEDGLRQEVGDQLLPLLRTVGEMERLAELAEEWQGREDLVAIADGTLVHWEFGAKQAGPARAALLARYLAALAKFRALGVPICSYISRPNSRDVSNALSVLATQDCGLTNRKCVQCSGRHTPLCDSLHTFNDARLMEHLRPGQRSALFRDVKPVLQLYPQPDRVLFCYFKLQDEMARIEIPQWAAAPEYLSRIPTLSVVYGQCLRGRGYLWSFRRRMNRL